MKPTKRVCLFLMLSTLLMSVSGAVFAQTSTVTSLNATPTLEGAGTITFVLTVDCQVALNMTLDWGTSDGTATLANNDYVQVTAGAPAPGRLPNVCPSASGAGTTYNLPVSIIDDPDFEPDETVQVTLSNPSVGAPSFSFNGITNASGTILNDDLMAVEADIALSASESIDPVIAGSGANNLTQIITVTNNGPQDATGLAVTITPPVIPAGVTLESVTPSSGALAANVWTIGGLGNGASETLTYVYTAGASAPDGGTLSVSAAVTALTETDPDNTNDSTSVTTGISRLVDIAMSSSESIDPVIAGSGAGNLVHIITVMNDGPSDASGVVVDVINSFPLGVTRDMALSSAGVFAAPVWTIGDLASGASATLTITFTATSAAPAGTDTIESIAALTAINENEVGSVPGPNGTSVFTSIAREVDLEWTSTESVDPVVAGSGPDNLVHTVTFINNGPSDASGVEWSGETNAPGGVSCVINITGIEGLEGFTATESAGGALCGFVSAGPQTIPAGSGFTVTMTLTVASNAPVGTDTIVSTAQVNAVNETDTNPGNDNTEVATSIERQIDLTVTKTDDPDPVVAGFELGGLEYVVTVTNNGPSDGDAVVINDPEAQFPVGVVLDSHVASAGTYDGTDWTVDLPSGATETLTMTVTVGPDTVPGDDVISNTAAVTGSGGGEIIINTGDDSVTETTTVLPTTATWTVSKDFLDDSSASITATLTCSSGEVTGPVEVTEGNPADLTVERFLMGPFGTTTCEVTESNLPPDYFQVSASENCNVDGVVHEDEFDCDFVNAPIKATFEVTKDFSDDNPAEVRVVLDCNTGLPLMQEAMVSEFGMPFDQITFIVQDYEIGTLDCDVYEEPIPTGYLQSYAASQDPIDSLSGPIGSTDDECFFTEIETGTFACDITNTLLPVDVTVNKEWIDEHPEFNNPEWVEIFFSCNAPILDDCSGAQDGICGSPGPGWGVYTYIDPDSPGEFQVLPHWDGSTVCSATEEVLPGVIVDQEDCAAIPLAPGVGGSCTIVNTRFYEGIPTLSQYGLMLLSLMMLGMGMVAFRRIA